MIEAALFYFKKSDFLFLDIVACNRFTAKYSWKLATQILITLVIYYCILGQSCSTRCNLVRIDRFQKRYIPLCHLLVHLSVCHRGLEYYFTYHKRALLRSYKERKRLPYLRRQNYLTHQNNHLPDTPCVKCRDHICREFTKVYAHR